MLCIHVSHKCLTISSCMVQHSTVHKNVMCSLWTDSKTLQRLCLVKLWSCKQPSFISVLTSMTSQVIKPHVFLQHYFLSRLASVFSTGKCQRLLPLGFQYLDLKSLLSAGSQRQQWVNDPQSTQVRGHNID